jgi:hypothetical protein
MLSSLFRGAQEEEYVKRVVGPVEEAAPEREAVMRALDNCYDYGRGGDQKEAVRSSIA